MLDRKSFPLTGIHFLWQETLSFDRKLFPLPGNPFIWQGIISFNGKSFPFIGNCFFWQKFISFDRKTFSLTGTYFFWEEIISISCICPLTGNGFSWQKIILMTWHSFLYFRKNLFKYDFCQQESWNISLELQGFCGNPVPRFPRKIPPCHHVLFLM